MIVGPVLIIVLLLMLVFVAAVIVGIVFLVRYFIRYNAEQKQNIHSQRNELDKIKIDDLH